MEVNGLQKAIDQIGLEPVTRFLPKGMKIHQCPMHGGYVSHYKTKNPLCPLCTVHSGEGNGTTATEVELFINLKDAVAKELGIK